MILIDLAAASPQQNCHNVLQTATSTLQVFIDTSGPEFIGWDDINGIDEVKQEIEEIIDYLKNPALLRLRGVSR